MALQTVVRAVTQPPNNATVVAPAGATNVSHQTAATTAAGNRLQFRAVFTNAVGSVASQGTVPRLARSLGFAEPRMSAAAL